MFPSRASQAGRGPLCPRRAGRAFTLIRQACPGHSARAGGPHSSTTRLGPESTASSRHSSIRAVARQVAQHPCEPGVTDGTVAGAETRAGARGRHGSARKPELTVTRCPISGAVRSRGFDCLFARLHEKRTEAPPPMQSDAVARCIPASGARARWRRTRCGGQRIRARERVPAGNGFRVRVGRLSGRTEER